MIRRIRRLLVVASVAVCVATLGYADAATRNFLWKASGKQGVVYLVGSVHMLTKDYYPLSPALDSAFKDSDLLVEEADLAEMLSPGAQLQMLTRGMLPSSQSLDKVVSAPTFALLNKRIAGLGMPIEALLRFKPWMLAMTLEALEWQKAGFDPELGLDKHFYDRAQTDGKAVQGLETLEYQVSRFDEMPMDQQDKMLADTLKNLDTEKANVNKLADAWQAGDLLAVEQIVLQEVKQDPLMYQRLLVERNRNWLPKLEALFARRGHAFVVVGAAHLIGPDGLLAMLKAKGYSVEQQ
ncbi:MAG: hypothetical protein AUH79_04240 [Betaproteobacteria bacterium 13_1_40CM_4_64_4]|nr:MAG: hypothetical protein AUH79_04240 [Betaproteobacteria bacterium 13_1_40CM_4_64_4]